MSPERWAGLAAYRLAPERVLGAAMVARQRAESLGRDMDVEDLQAGARSQNSTGLNRLARRLEPRVGYDDLVASDHVQRQLRGIAARARLRQRVLDEWNMAASSSRGRGVTALFAGDSGTGKTMSAEVVAGSLGLDLYVIDLSTVVDKYIGETEKNLDRIFDQAEQRQWRAALRRGRRHLRKALRGQGRPRPLRQRRGRLSPAAHGDSSTGIAILTTNLRANIDDAFLRRLDVLIDFPMPDPAGRRQLWERQLRPELPVGDDIDVVFLADAFELSGGNIRNIVVASAFDAAAEDQPVTMAHLVRATAGEYRKLGRLCVEAEFGPYFPTYHPWLRDRPVALARRDRRPYPCRPDGHRRPGLEAAMRIHDEESPTDRHASADGQDGQVRHRSAWTGGPCLRPRSFTCSGWPATRRFPVCSRTTPTPTRQPTFDPPSAPMAAARCPDHIRRTMEPALGSDLSSVRVHTGGTAQRSAQAPRGPGLHDRRSPRLRRRRLLARQPRRPTNARPRVDPRRPAAIRSGRRHRRRGRVVERSVRLVRASGRGQRRSGHVRRRSFEGSVQRLDDIGRP